MMRVYFMRLSSSTVRQDEREAVVTCRLKVPLDRLVDLTKGPPRVRARVEPLEEQKINQHARHPGDLRLVANDRPAAASLEEGSRESAAGGPTKHTAAAEVDEAVIAVIAAKGVAETIGSNGVEDGRDTSGRAM